MSSGRLQISALLLGVWLSVCGAGSFGTLTYASESAGQRSLFWLGGGARAQGMGGAFVSIADDASAVYWNPGGLWQLTYGAVLFQHATLFESSALDLFSVVFPTLELGTFGFGAMRIGTGDIVGRDQFGLKTGTFSFSQSQIIFSYSKKLPQAMGVGVSLKTIAQNLSDLNDVGFGADLGLVSSRWRGLALGLNFQDLIGAKLTLKQEQQRFPSTIKTGINYQTLLKNNNLGLTLAFDFDYGQDKIAASHIGGEFTVQRAYFLRAGWDRGELTLGGGTQYKFISIDYAFHSFADLSSSHQLSLTVTFGQSRQARITARNQREQERLLAHQRQESIEKARLYFSAAEIQAQQGNLDSAIILYQSALAHDSTQTLALERIMALRQQKEQVLARQVQQKSLEAVLAEHLRLANEYLQQAQFQLASAEANQILRLAPGNHEALAIRDSIIRQTAEARARIDSTASAHFVQKRYAQAITQWNQILQYEPADSGTILKIKRAEDQLQVVQLVQHGVERYTAGEYSAAQTAFLSALRLHPEEPVATEYLRLSRQKMARVTTLEDLKKDPRIWQTYTQGLAAFQTGAYQKAIDLWQEVLQVYPNAENAQRNIELAKRRLKRSGKR